MDVLNNNVSNDEVVTVEWSEATVKIGFSLKGVASGAFKPRSLNFVSMTGVVLRWSKNIKKTFNL